MICRTCLRRVAGAAARPIAAHPLSRTPALLQISTTTAVPTTPTLTTRCFTTTSSPANAAPAAAEATATTSSAGTPPNLTPLTGSEASKDQQQQAQQQRPLSSCPAGTVLTGLNYFKGKSDPVALPDEEYPEWLWRCLEVQKKTDESADGAEVGDEFSKSKKQRRLAAKRQRALEARMLATGDLEALVPKVPLQKQSVNLPAPEKPGDVQQALTAHDAREELRKAMRKERRAKIKESNYLKAM
ncbi:hypothetical protein VTJ04DRAFT_3197 [Mycothermus thermophilus]|uniref:mitochondrial 54S ribosomal protein mL54 n=1 Tax=Humicola insolens TaxID=85995 RepID=UPI0037423B67